jgi:lipoprotein-anchoring transpeptidase ErfK/SrfK
MRISSDISHRAAVSARHDDLRGAWCAVYWSFIFASVAVVLAGLTMSSAALAGKVIVFDRGVAPGTIIVRTRERNLYLVLGGGKALRYTVGVGRAGRQWAGRSFIVSKHIRPNWSPPPEIKRDRPHLPDVVPSGSPANPMGAAALTLSGGQYAIHGTNEPRSIGGFVSYGCIRMYNKDVLDLYGRVRVGTPVLVMP